MEKYNPVIMTSFDIYLFRLFWSIYDDESRIFFDDGGNVFDRESVEDSSFGMQSHLVANLFQCRIR